MKQHTRYIILSIIYSLVFIIWPYADRFYLHKFPDLAFLIFPLLIQPFTVLLTSIIFAYIYDKDYIHIIILIGIVMTTIVYYGEFRIVIFLLIYILLDLLGILIALQIKKLKAN